MVLNDGVVAVMDIHIVTCCALTRTCEWIYQARSEYVVFTRKQVSNLICAMQIHKWLVHIHHIAIEYISLHLAIFSIRNKQIMLSGWQ